MKKINTPEVPKTTGYYFALDLGGKKKVLWFDRAEFERHGEDSTCFKDSVPTSFGDYQRYAMYELECVFIETEESPKGVEGEWQLCPKCNGQGTVCKPPYLPAEVNEWSGTEMSYQCDVCNGKKIIEKPLSQQPKEDSKTN